MSAQNMTEADQRTLWHNLASGAESGMDFTSRWFQDPQNISTIQTTSIIPAELNAYLYQMENNIADFADMMGNETEADSFREYAAARKVAMNTLMYNATEGEASVFSIFVCDGGTSLTGFQTPSTSSSSRYLYVKQVMCMASRAICTALHTHTHTCVCNCATGAMLSRFPYL